MSQQTSRRERRAEARRVAHQQPTKAESKRLFGLPPIVLASLAAVVVGAAAIGFIASQGVVGSSLRAPTTTTPPALAHGRTIGADTAPVKLDVYSDFQCPNCAMFWHNVVPGLINDAIGPGTAQLVYHDMAFLGPESVSAAGSARCADAQDQFWPYHDLLFANQGAENSGAFSDVRLAAMASTVGIEMGPWSTCRTDAGTASAVQQDTAAGAARGVNGTPTVFVNGTKVASYDLPSIEKAIAAATGK